MQLMSMKCPACGAPIDSRITSRMVTCEYCGSKFVLDGEEAAAFVDSMADEYEYEDNDTSDLSMTAFASEVCDDFLTNFDNGDSFESSKKILRGLEIGNDNVYLIHDDTMFKSGKNGFAITDQGLYCRDLGESATFTSWEDLARLPEPHLDDCYVKCGKKCVAYFTDDSDLLDDLLALYEDLHYHATCKY